MDKLLSKPKIVFYAFVINLFAFVLIPFLLCNDKGQFLNILPDLPELFVDYFWTILIAIDSKTVAYSPLADIVFQIPNILPKSINILLFFSVFVGLFLLFIKFLLQQNLLTIKQLYFYVPFVLFSYGYIFEFLWGQWNLISFVLIMYSVFVVYKKNRLYSYLLFAFAASLKVYPFIFILLYIRNLKEIKRWIFDIISATTIFIALFFVQGYDVLLNYITQLTQYSSTPAIWYANMSIYCFNYNLNELLGFDLGIFSYLFVLICFAIIFLIQIQQTDKSLNGITLYTLVIIALLLPSVSMDYKLSLIVICFPIIYNFEFKINNYIDKFILFIFSALIFSTLFSYKFYEHILKNWFFESKFIPLLLLLIIMTIYSIIYKSDYIQKKNK